MVMCQPNYWLYSNLPEDEFRIFAKFIRKRFLFVTVRVTKTQGRFSVIQKHEILHKVNSKNWRRLLATEQKFKWTFPDMGVLEKHF